jgi:hypothetical protein
MTVLIASLFRVWIVALATVSLLRITDKTSCERSHSQLAHEVIETGDKHEMTCRQCLQRRCNETYDL